MILACRLNFHGDELHPLGGAELGAELGAEAVSHLEEISSAGVAGLARAGSVAVILPTTAYILRLPAPPVRQMLQAGCIVALGTDFNPNAYCLSLPVCMHLACVNLKDRLSALEILFYFSVPIQSYLNGHFTFICNCDARYMT